MPHRLLCVAILVFWSLAAGALFTRDLLPTLMVGDPPDLRAITQADDRPTETHWGIMVLSDGKDESSLRSVGRATTRSERKRDGWYSLSSEAQIDAGELLKGTPFQWVQAERIEVGGTYNIDPSGNLDYFRAWVRPDDGSRLDLLTITGQLEGGELVVTMQGPVAALNTERRFPYQPRGLVHNALGPLDRMPGLQVSQRWESRVVSPLTGRVETGTVEVVRRSSIIWDSNPVAALEVVTKVGPLSARTWVRPADGLVLRQEVPFPFVKMRLDRIPDQDATPLARDDRE
ncbi:MAG: hypothetical protein IRY99_09625 [Isosphaeraceae bacterium]|nr:hypothetical protein [Isosphaeraceae bacterium]